MGYRLQSSLKTSKNWKREKQAKKCRIMKKKELEFAKAFGELKIGELKGSLIISFWCICIKINYQWIGDIALIRLMSFCHYNCKYQMAKYVLTI